MKVKFIKLDTKAELPYKKHPTDAGFDLTATSCTINQKDRLVTYGTGVAAAIPEGYVGLLFPRSSVRNTGLQMCNCVGVIDAHYRGEIMATFYISTKGDVEKFYEPGDRIAQLIIMPIPEVEFVEVDSLDETDRGTGGHGSTGK